MLRALQELGIPVLQSYHIQRPMRPAALLEAAGKAA
jgi:EAL domain-containing protein (putative c-di-GMP-specific phosphodiesterase class I)